MKRFVILVVVALLSACCGGSGGGSETEGTEDQTPIADQGFAENGIFAGALDDNEVLLVMEAGIYFLVAGDLASTREYSIDSVLLSGSSPAYRLIRQW
ncbi:MAG: hypothetical protein VB957_15915 [Pseudomonadales bacterium]|jgi:hypothetical protein